MPHDTSLLATVVLGLALAACGGFLARKLRLPPLVGYLLAGVAIGPFTPGFVGEVNLAGQLAEIGIILLMFGVGLHFSIEDLLAVRRIALPGALAQVMVATAIGTGVALIWGWSPAAGVVLGLALSCASTVVLLRALEDRSALDSVNGHIAVGWLVVEDLVMVLALVLLPAIAGPLGADAHGLAARLAGGSIGLAFLFTIGKVAAFIALVFLVGTRVVPWALAQVARTGSRELFTLSVLALALGIAFGSAELFGVSFALGAFFAGVVLSESDFSHQAAADSLPLKDAFAVLFFVSVGMLFDPTVLVRDPLSVAAIVLVIVFGKSLAAFAIVLAFGYPLTTALTVSASLAQIGEFSFILAGVGIALGVLPPAGRDLILAGALLSITVNPIVFAAIDPLTAWLRRRPRLLARLERRGSRLATLSEGKRGSDQQDHAVIVGYGRVGGVLGEALKAQGLPFVVVDENRRRVEELRRRDIAAVYGDATAAGVLEAAGVDRARLLVIAAPRGFQTQRIIELARQINPQIRTAVRTHSVGELAHFERQGVGIAIMGEREIGLGLLDYALQSFGFSEERTHSVVQQARKTGEGGAFERRPAAGLSSTSPELQPRQEKSDIQ
ncbi:YbaL family putative K(+) efflux transporter [Reyranella sp. CPCC 100927]|uniref:YbaL family putative K(+) efflux transporter n=1 Tax=Reyranella sp. CPCC 100927 TaxID=2599616 RepID=UPI0011B4D1C4|nr:YbaL family putative K(+) efflux transporter [Reyranella sp. CPCC 100927]TWT05930.1 Kef family K(+) transporter [Reyranella sp. CPCC 100927]